MGTVLVRPAGGLGPSVVALTGEWDVADERLADILVATLRSGNGRLIVDMLNVSFIDSSVVRALVAAQLEAARREGWVRLVYTHHVIRKVIEICGLADVLPQFGSVAAAARGHEVHRFENVVAADGRAR